MRTARSSPYGGLCPGDLPDRDPLDRDLPGERPPDREPLDRKPPGRETPQKEHGIRQSDRE